MNFQLDTRVKKALTKTLPSFADISHAGDREVTTLA